MAGEVINSTGLLDEIFPVVLDKLGPLIWIVQAVGVAFVLYVIYLVVKAVLNWRDRKRIKNIEKKVNEIDEKLNRLLKKKSKKS